MSRDFVACSRYYYDVVERRRISLSAKQMSRFGIAQDPPVLLEWCPALDIILSFPLYPTHSEYFSFVRRLYPQLIKNILVKSAVSEVTRVVNNISFLSG